MHPELRTTSKSISREKKHRSLYAIFSGNSADNKPEKPYQKIIPLTPSLNRSTPSTFNLHRTQNLQIPKPIVPIYEPFLTKIQLKTQNNSPNVIPQKPSTQANQIKQSKVSGLTPQTPAPTKTANEQKQEEESEIFDRTNRLSSKISSRFSLNKSLRESSSQKKSTDMTDLFFSPVLTPEISISPIFHNKLTKIYNDRAFHAKINLLRYRDHVFRAASRLAKDEIPPYPDWIYQNEDFKYLEITKICVGGVFFYVFDKTLTLMKGSKLAKCLWEHKSDQIPFFDRDPICFNSILNFYRTGRLHVPPNTCLTLYEEELEFWGVKEDFMETCCSCDYQTYKTANITLKKYIDDMRKEQYRDVTQRNNKAVKFKRAIYAILTIGQGNVLARWFSFICGMAIVLSIFLMIFGCTETGRISHNGSEAIYQSHQKTSDFFTMTTPLPIVKTLEMVLLGFFLAEMVSRFVLCPGKLEFFSDSSNWIDLLSTISALFSSVIFKEKTKGIFEGYLLVFKIPRVFRLFRLTLTLRSGMEAFILTMFASATELKLVFFILLIVAILYGSMAFLLEVINSDMEMESRPVFINTIFKGIWWAFLTLAGVGYGDYNVLTTPGRYMLGFLTIMGGIIISRLPVPIVLKHFTVYFNQAHARMNKKSKFIVKMEDPEFKCSEKNVDENVRKERIKKFSKIFDPMKFKTFTTQENQNYRGREKMSS